MSTSASKSSAATTSTTTDKKITAGDGAVIAQDGSSIYVENLDAGLAAEAMDLMKGLAENSNDGAYSLSKYALDIGENLTGKVFDTLAAKDEQLSTLFDKVTTGTQTTLRDTMATLAQNGQYLAGSAQQSGGVSGWMSRNPALAALFAVVASLIAFFAFTYFRSPKPSRKK